MKFAVGDIRPNPFRHIERYPIRAEKVTALRESLRTTGFWGNVVARVKNGYPEIAYGHHRRDALIAEFGPEQQVELIVRDLDDETMLQIMARENMEEWGTSAAVEQETIRAVVEAYAEGQIELPAVAPRARGLRNAPSFVPRAGGDKPYTAQSVGAFLGWMKPDGDPQDKVRNALAALQFIEEGILSEADFDGLSTKEAEAVVQQARQARAADEAAAAAARREAEDAARRAEQAEREREAAAERERQAKEARDREEAARAAQERREAEQERKRAEKQQAQREKKAAEHRDKGRTKATTAGRAVSKAVRSGEGYRRAGEVARRAVPREAGPPPDIDVFTRRLAADLGRILDPDGDPRFDRLTELAKFHEHINDFERKNLIATLEQLSSRIDTFVLQLKGAKPTRAALPRGGS